MQSSNSNVSVKVLFAAMFPLVTVSLSGTGICEEALSLSSGVVSFCPKPVYSGIESVDPVGFGSGAAEREESVGTLSAADRPVLRFRNVRLVVEDPSDAAAELGSGVLVAQRGVVEDLSSLVDATVVRVVSGSFRIQNREMTAQKKEFKKDGVGLGGEEVGLDLAKVNDGAGEGGLVGKVVVQSVVPSAKGEQQGGVLKGTVGGGSWELVGKGGFVGDERARLTSVVSIRRMPSVSGDVDSVSSRISVQVRGNVQIGALY